MAHGQPDYGVTSKASVIHKVSDMGELAARLGSPSVFDRRGNVIWMTDFENGIEGWKVITSGTGAGVYWSPDYKLRGGFSCKIVAGSDDERYAEILRELAFPNLSKLGFEAAWTESDDMEKVEGYIILYTGVYVFRWGYKYDHTTGIGYIETADGVWTAITDAVSIHTSDYLFYTSKVVGDASLRTYHKLITSATEIDISAYPCVIGVSAELYRMDVKARLYSKSGKNATIYMDSAVVTQNEP